MHDALEPIDSEGWHIFRLGPHLFLKDLLYINGLLGYLCHDNCFANEMQK